MILGFLSPQFGKKSILLDFLRFFMYNPAHENKLMTYNEKDY